MSYKKNKSKQNNERDNTKKANTSKHNNERDKTKQIRQEYISKT